MIAFRALSLGGWRVLGRGLSELMAGVLFQFERRGLRALLKLGFSLSLMAKRRSWCDILA
jgi:hypothetical protein